MRWLMMYRLKEIYIKDFRGFREEKIELPEADIILLVGNNGMGKTSFFDAIEWGFTGSLKRYEPSSQEKNQEIFLTNKYAESTGRVELKLEDDQGNIVTIKRETHFFRGNDFNNGLLSIVGSDCENVPELLVREQLKEDFDFKASFNFSHLLSQELVSSFVRNYKATDRYTILSNLVGVKNYTYYRDKLNLLRKECMQRIEKIVDDNDKMEKEILRLEGKVNKEKIDEKELQRFYKEVLLKIKVDENNLLQEGIFPENLFELDADTVIKHISACQKPLISSRHKLEKKLEEISKLQNSRLAYENSLKKINDLNKVIRLAKLTYLRDNFDDETTPDKLKSIIKRLNSYIDRKEYLLEIINSNSSDLNKVDDLLEEDKLASGLFSVIKKEIEENKQAINGLKDKITGLENKVKEIESIEMNLLNTAQDYFREVKETEHCPVCLSRIDFKEVTKGLEERLKLSGNKAGSSYRRELKELKVEMEKAEKKKEKLNNKLKKAIDNYRFLISSRMKKAQRKEEIYQTRLKIQEKCSKYLEELQIKHSSSAILEELQTKDKLDLDGYQEVEDLIEEKERNLAEEEKVVNTFKIKLKNLGIKSANDLDKAYQDTLEKMNSIDLKINWMNGIEGEIKEIIEKMQQSGNRRKLKVLQTDIEKNKLKIDLLNEKVNKLKLVEQKVPEIMNNMMENILNPYKELANRIYRKINPQPFFNTIDWERDSSRGNNPTLVLKVRDEDGHEANPSYIYSAAQVNIIVLSLFLSFVIQNNWSKLNSFFLDDPVQSMDDINVFSFVDVLRSMYLNKANPRQLFISTHDQKLYAFMKKKFRMFNLCTMEFKSYGKYGPEIDVN